MTGIIGLMMLLTLGGVGLALTSLMLDVIFLGCVGGGQLYMSCTGSSLLSLVLLSMMMVLLVLLLTPKSGLLEPFTMCEE